MKAAGILRIELWFARPGDCVLSEKLPGVCVCVFLLLTFVLLPLCGFAVRTTTFCKLWQVCQRH